VNARGGELPAEVPRGVDRRRKKKAPVGESVRAATLFGLAGVGVLSIVHLLVRWLGLPDWVLPGVVVWLAAGVPVMLLTGRQQFKRTVARAGGAQTEASGIRGHLTWRNAVLGGGVALSLLVVFTASFMVMRITGVRPVGTLTATGEFEKGGRVVLGEFTDRTDEPGLAAAVTEALRVDLAQSQVVSLLSQTAMRQALGRMGLAPATKIDRQVALEIAVREGIPAVVVGEVLSVGHGFVLSARVIKSADEQELLALRETASDVSDVLAAVERLSRHLRERIGESLKDLRSSPALSSVTTNSLPALRSFSAGVQLIREGKWSQANDDFAEAVGLDSTFAEAYVRLGYNLTNQGGARSAAVDAMAAAFRHRSHLPESRRKSVEAAYYSMIGEPSKSAAAYEASLTSGDRGVLNNLALQYLTLRQPDRAVDVLVEARGDSPNAGIIAVNLTRALFRTGRVDQAFQVWNAFTDANPDYQLNARHTARLEVARDSIRAAQAVLEEAEQTEDHFAAAIVSRYRAFVNAALGRISDALAILEVQRDAAVVLGDRATAFAMEVKAAELLLGNGRSSNEVARVLDNAVGREGFGTLAPLDRLLPTRARLRARLGDLDQARRLLREHETEVLALYPNIDQQDRLLAVAELELAEGSVMDAAVTFRIADMGRCVICALPGLARAYEQAGEVDSAIVTYERFLSTPYADRIDLIGVDQAGVLMRLGQLHEVKGNRDAAVSYYDRFIELRRDADPVLQQEVQGARERRLQLLRQ